MAKNDDSFKMRLPRDLLEEAKAKAEREDIPLAQQIRRFLRAWVKDDPPKGKEEKPSNSD